MPLALDILLGANTLQHIRFLAMSWPSAAAIALNKVVQGMRLQPTLRQRAVHTKRACSPPSRCATLPRAVQANADAHSNLNGVPTLSQPSHQQPAAPPVLHVFAHFCLPHASICYTCMLVLLLRATPGHSTAARIARPWLPEQHELCPAIRCLQRLEHCAITGPGLPSSSHAMSAFLRHDMPRLQLPCQHMPRQQLHVITCHVSS